MKLSADKINETSPYWVIPLDEKSFRFRTDNGVVYVVGFYADDIFSISDAYHFYIMRKDNPYYDDVVATFHRIAEMLPALMVRPKSE